MPCARQVMEIGLWKSSHVGWKAWLQRPKNSCLQCRFSDLELSKTYPWNRLFPITLDQICAEIVAQADPVIRTARPLPKGW